jgi:hypothetical protein
VVSTGRVSDSVTGNPSLIDDALVLENVERPGISVDREIVDREIVDREIVDREIVVTRLEVV